MADDWGDDWGMDTGAASNHNSNVTPQTAGAARVDNYPTWSQDKESDGSRNWLNNRTSVGRGKRIASARDTSTEDWGWDSEPQQPSSNRSGGWSNSNSRNYSDNNRNNSSGGDCLTIHINSSDVGKVIGRGGSTIKDFQNQSGARIKVHNDSVNGETQVDISGSQSQKDTARDLIERVTGGNRSAGGGFDDIPKKQQKTEPSSEEMEFDWDAAIKESEEATRQKWESLAPLNKAFYQEDPEVRNMSRDEVEQFRKDSNDVKIAHFNEKDKRPLPNPVRTFRQAFSNFPDILAEIEKNKFEKPSPIQSQSWPVLLQGIDLIGIAQTGTGKTLAYLLPAMIHIENQKTPRDKRPGPTALILAPTRELAQQIEKESRKYSYRGIRSLCIYGGGDRKSQCDIVNSGIEIVIATPGRLNDLCMSRVLDLTSVSYLVLDEADRMLDMGFEPQIRKILLDIRPDRQTVMMSATWPEQVRRMALNYMTDPFQTYVGTLDLAAVHSVTQKIVMIDAEEKRRFLYDFFENMMPEDKVIVFVGKKILADELSSDLALRTVDCQCIHGDRDQSDREQALEDLKTGSVKILIATDVASRGLDIEDITHIFNYDFPRNVEEYVHRIGRTGRAGRSGQSITLMTREDWKHADELIKILTEADQEVPDGLPKMAERYKVYLEKREAEKAAYGGRAGGGGFGGGGRGCFKCGEEGHMSRECPSGGGGGFRGGRGGSSRGGGGYGGSYGGGSFGGGRSGSRW